jgi:hypothetical protein
MPPFDAQKHPFVESLNAFTKSEIANAQYLLAKSWPCSVEEVDATGTIVTVKVEMEQPDYTFPKIKCAVYGPEWVRWPIQKGDKGVMICSSFDLGAMTGLGEGIARWAPAGNLGSGVFFPVGNTKFSERSGGEDKQVVIYGPEGVVLKTAPAAIAPSTRANVPSADTSTKLVITEDNGFQFFVQGQLKFIIDSAGARYVGSEIPGKPGQTFGINTTDTGTHVDGINFLPHLHSNVQTGSGNSGPINQTLSPAEDEP